MEVARLEGDVSTVIVAITVRRSDAQARHNLACPTVGCTGGWRAHQAASEVESGAPSAIGIVVKRLPDREDILRTEVCRLLRNNSSGAT
jgi:hypothetical protein